MNKSDEAYKEYRREIVRRSMRKRREKARAAGLCIQCTAVPAVSGRTLCYECSQKQLAANRRYASGKKPKED